MIEMNKQVTEVIFLLDRSGSMAGLEADTIGGFNAFIEKQNKLPGQTKLTVVLFDHEYELLWDGIDATEAILTDEDYYVRGTTALLDAIGKTIVDVKRRLKEEGNQAKVIFVITTDGMENSSQEFTRSQVKELIEHQSQHHNWNFIFMGANMDAIQEAGYLGINKQNAYEFEVSNKGIMIMYENIHEAIIDQYEK